MEYGEVLTSMLSSIISRKPSSSSSFREEVREERRRNMGLESENWRCWTGGGEESWVLRETDVSGLPDIILCIFSTQILLLKERPTMRAGAELGRQANASFDWLLLKERRRDRDTGLVGFLNSKPSCEKK